MDEGSAGAQSPEQAEKETSPETPLGDIYVPPAPVEPGVAPPRESLSENEQVLGKAVRYIKAKRGGDLAAIFLVGSAARDAQTLHSDVDLVVLTRGRDNGQELVRILSRIVDIRYLGHLNADEQLTSSLRLPGTLRKARILFEFEVAGTQLLEKAHARFRQGLPALTLHEKIRLRAESLHWLGKADDVQHQPATARYLFSIFLDECMNAFHHLRGLWPSAPKDNLAFIAQRDQALGQLLQHALTTSDFTEQLAVGRRIVDHLFKDIPAPARID